MREQVFELRAGARPRKKAPDLTGAVGQFLLGEFERKASSQIELPLAWYRQIQGLVIRIIRWFVASVIKIRDQPYLSRLPAQISQILERPNHTKETLNKSTDLTPQPLM
ncbi:MAG: hypothetical protein V4757_11920 [Pseudomonadota bacterium]